VRALVTLRGTTKVVTTGKPAWIVVAIERAVNGNPSRLPFPLPSPRLGERMRSRSPLRAFPPHLSGLFPIVLTDRLVLQSITDKRPEGDRRGYWLALQALQLVLQRFPAAIPHHEGGVHEHEHETQLAAYRQEQRERQASLGADPVLSSRPTTNSG
jgi:hypothetical protein